MADGASVNVKVDLSRIEKKFSGTQMERVQYSLANKIIKDTERFVPMREGHLRGNVSLLSSGQTIRYGISYATYQYYKKYRNYTTPGTGPHWDMVAKGKYLSSWRNLVKNGILNG